MAAAREAGTRSSVAERAFPLFPLLPLAAVYGVQYFDQILLGLLAQPIKVELSISDTQLGLLTGASFTLLYTILGLPLARLSDRHNRKLMIVVSTLIFSLATAACGLASGFALLCLARMGVAVGEAGTMPAAVSMLADVYRSDRRRLVMSLHSCGAFLATAGGLLAVSALTGHLGWRSVFFAAGAAGVILALVVLWTVKEPARSVEVEQGAKRSAAQDLKTILRIPTFVFLALALGIGSIASSAMINWFPAFLARSHHVPQAQIVLYLALAWGCAATTGGTLLGLLSNRLHARGGHLPVYLLGLVILSFTLAGCVAFSVNDLHATIAAFMVTLFIMGGVRGPAFAILQDIVPPNMRATASAVFMFAMYFIGVTLGPLFTGLISDWLGARQGPEALRHALLIVVATSGAISTLFLLIAGLLYPRGKQSDQIAGEKQ